MLFMLMLALSGGTLVDIKLRTNFEKTVDCVILVNENKKIIGIRSYCVNY